MSRFTMAEWQRLCRGVPGPRLEPVPTAAELRHVQRSETMQAELARRRGRPVRSPGAKCQRCGNWIEHGEPLMLVETLQATWRLCRACAGAVT